jgi:hypothetical protein
MSILKKGILASTLAASALVSTATPVMARDYYRHHDNTAAVAIGVGILGLAVGAIAASSNNDDRRYRRSDYYYDRRVSADQDRYYRNESYDRSRAYDGRSDWNDRSGYGDQYGSGDDRYYSRRGY